MKFKRAVYRERGHNFHNQAELLGNALETRDCGVGTRGIRGGEGGREEGVSPLQLEGFLGEAVDDGGSR